MKVFSRITVLSVIVVLYASVCVAQSDETSAEVMAPAEIPSDDRLLKDVTADELQNIINSYKGDKAVLVNVWATWCAPCVEEFPEIVKLQRNYPEKLKVIFVSADFDKSRDKAVKFLKKQNVDWTTYFKTGDDQKFIESLSDNWSGALPFTKVIGMNGKVIDSWEQSASYEKFEQHVKTAINL